MLLSMGFTGEKALALKIAYIEQFNAMEKELQDREKNTQYRIKCRNFILINEKELKKEKNTKDALRKHVDKEDKQILLRSQCTTLENIPNRGLTIINESGLYSLIFASELKGAKDFKHWVTSDVLPTIRKTGSYNPKPQQ